MIFMPNASCKYGVCIFIFLMHFGIHYAPFGGVGWGVDLIVDLLALFGILLHVSLCLELLCQPVCFLSILFK